MIFSPQSYKIEDQIGVPFIDAPEIKEFLKIKPTTAQVEAAISYAKAKNRLSLAEVATLLNAPKSMRNKVLEAAKEVKQTIYGNRIVLFAPLYVGNLCSNRCAYCSFRADNEAVERKTLTHNELIKEIVALEEAGHKRLVLVYGEHKQYDAKYISETVRTTYSVSKGCGEIRRVNINAAPMSTEDFAIVAASGIGTYQIFQESYDKDVYKKYHLAGAKADYDWRLTAFDRAMKAGINDVGLGVLFGLGDWRFEIMGLVRHTNHLEACFSVGPHTISVPRINETIGGVGGEQPLNDDDFVYAVAVLRLAVPYAGLILTARETAELRDKAIEYGVSQIDGGTKLDIGSYSKPADINTSSQFAIHDDRPLSEVITRLVAKGRIPSFCTACYRKGRTGEHFMEFSTAGFIKRFCTPNAILTFAEYLEDYATEEMKIEGYKLIEKELAKSENKEVIEQRLERIKQGVRDLNF